MAASLADVTDVLRRQIEANAEVVIELRAQTKALGQVVELLTEIRDDASEASYENEDDEEEEGDEQSAGLDGVVDQIAGQLREKIRAGGLKGFLNRKKKPNGAAPKEVRPIRPNTPTE